MIDKEALKLALEFIENSECGTADLEALIKEALAQEQEPVAFCDPTDPCNQTAFSWPGTARMRGHTTPLITSSPPQRTWVGLTRDEQSFIYSSLHESTLRKDSFWVDFANAIEAKLKEKNT